MIYEEAMQTVGRGIPVWEPCPTGSGNGQRVRVGDVGYFHKEGFFVTLFNMYEPAEPGRPLDKAGANLPRIPLTVIDNTVPLSTKDPIKSKHITCSGISANAYV